MPTPNYPSFRPQQRNEEANVWFTVPILMGLFVGAFMLVAVLVGTAGLFSTQTMERWPDAQHDKNLIVPQ